MTRNLSYCVVSECGIVGSYSPGKGFSPMLLRNLRPTVRTARRLANVTKVEHGVAIYDSGTGAVIRAAKVEARALRRRCAEKPTGQNGFKVPARQGGASAGQVKQQKGKQKQ